MDTPFSTPPQQLGCVVPDLDAAIAEWAAKGVGPFLVMRGSVPSGYLYEGVASKPKLDVAFSQDGDVQVELIQPANDATSSYRDFLAAGGNGLHHHGWFCDDYDGAVAAAEREGRKVLQQGSWGGMRFVYYQPIAGDEIIVELIELTDVSRRIFGLVRTEAAGWDGTDPSRSMLRTAGWGLRAVAARAQIRTLFGRG